MSLATSPTDGSTSSTTTPAQDDAARSAVAARLAALAQQPLDPAARAVEGLRLAASTAGPVDNAQARAIADAGANARTALDRTDLSPAQASQVAEAVKGLGGALVDGKADPLDHSQWNNLYDVATRAPGDSRFVDGLAQLTQAARRASGQDDVDLSHMRLDPELANGPASPRFGEQADRTAVTPYSLSVLKQVAHNAGVDADKLQITSTRRTADDQARIMLGQLEHGGLTRYGANGQVLIREYRDGVQAGLPDGVIRGVMAATAHSMFDESPSRPVSNHMVDLKEMNVFDVAPSSIPADHRMAFQRAATAAMHDGTGVSNLLSPYTPQHDQAFHIEIAQPTSAQNTAMTSLRENFRQDELKAQLTNEHP